MEVRDRKSYLFDNVCQIGGQFVLKSVLCLIMSHSLGLSGLPWEGEREERREGGRKETAYAHVNIAAAVSVLCVPRC